MRQTFDLSKARSYSRNKRAGKAVKLLREHLDSRLDDYRLDESVNHAIWERGASKPPRSIELKYDESEETPIVTVAGGKDEKPEQPDQAEPETDEEQPQSSTSSEHEEALDGTVSEAKDAIQEMEDPDIDRLLQLERVGKDRKTLKEWLESRQ